MYNRILEQVYLMGKLPWMHIIKYHDISTAGHITLNA